MRIVHFLLGRCNPDSANGVDKTVYYLSKHQAALGHDVAVFSFTSKSALPIPGVSVKTYPPRKFPVSLPRNLVRDLYDWQPDIVHFHSLHIPLFIRLGCLLSSLKIPYCVTPHHTLSPIARRRRWLLKTSIWYIGEKQFVEGAIFIHAISKVDLIGARKLGITTPVIIAPNGLDLSCIPSSRVDKDEVKGQGRILKFLGRFQIDMKGLDLLLTALHECKKYDIRLMLGGRDWKGGSKKIRKLVNRYKLGDQVVILGYLSSDEKWKFLGSGGAFVHTSRWEAGIPFSVLEAMGMGLPCLLTTAADPMGKVAEHGAGLVVEPTVEAISEGIRRIVEMTDDELKTMGKRARLLVETQFNWKSTAQKLIEAYNEFGRRYGQ